jgi:hypothetical protein
MKIHELWHSSDANDWTNALSRYWNYVKPANTSLEKELNELDSKNVQMMSAVEFYNFMLDRYFKWKYTVPKRYATTTLHFKKYQSDNDFKELLLIKQRLFDFDKNDIRLGLEIATSIKGLGTAGGSGLLSLLFPHYFGTVDQFAVKALCEIEDLSEINELRKMNPDNLTIRNGVILIQIMRKKSLENNRDFKTDFWTPRKIDMILWTYGRDKQKIKETCDLKI